jgi:signal transduction histidine kinase
LSALESLGRAAESASLGEVALPEVVADTADSIEELTGIPVRRTGPSPCTVIGDRALIELVLRNGLMNAAESTKEASTEESVIVSWGDTDIDYWISILDSGIGLPENISGMREIGTSTKLGHLGMGLAIAEQASESMSGRIELAARDDGGVRFEFRWPKGGVR